jgi:RNA polymerase sigma factor for flagellar operon FliA
MTTAARTYARVAIQGRRDELVLSHLALVRHVLGRLAAELPPGVDLENLEAAGTLGLVEAANHFDADRGTKFETFAFLRIRGAMLDELRRNCPLSQSMLQQVARIRKAYDGLRQPVTLEALTDATGFSEDTVVDCLAALRLTRMLSWDSAEDAAAAGVDERQEAPDALAEQAEQRDLLAQAIEELPERERLVVTLYYVEDLRLKEIGNILNLSESRVSRVLNAALFRLGEYIRAREN